MIRRRDFITLLGGVAAAWPLAARAQQAARIGRIGWLSTNTGPSQANLNVSLAASMAVQVRH
jgi:putative ABC transport system substrate-binding protein